MLAIQDLREVYSAGQISQLMRIPKLSVYNIRAQPLLMNAHHAFSFVNCLQGTCRENPSRQLRERPKNTSHTIRLFRSQFSLGISRHFANANHRSCVTVTLPSKPLPVSE